MSAAHNITARGYLLSRNRTLGASCYAAQKKRATAHSLGQPLDSAEGSPDLEPGKARPGGRKKADGEKRP